MYVYVNYFALGRDARYCDEYVCLWTWLGPPLTALQYVMYFRFCGWCHVSHNDPILHHLYA